MQENDFSPHFLNTPQQDLQALFSHETEFDEDLQYALDRSCTVHCIEAIAELHGLHIPSLDRVQEYIAFLRKHGAHPIKGSASEGYYSVDDGWYNIAVADLLRANGFEIVSQNLHYNAQASNITAAQNAGRIRSTREQINLEHLATYGGKDRLRWLGAIEETLRCGYALVSIVIPSSEVVGAVGRHSVVVLSIDSEGAVYFDPDKLVLERHGEDAQRQKIVRLDENKLIYKQPTDRFLTRMTGEVMHIFPPTLLNQVPASRLIGSLSLWGEKKASESSHLVHRSAV